MLLAGLAAALFEALHPNFRHYCQAVLDNARHLAISLTEHGWPLITGGTHNHACLVDLSTKKINGKQAAKQLADVGIICNANQIPIDPHPPARPSGLRLGTPAVTTLGMQPEDMATIAGLLTDTLSNYGDDSALEEIAQRVSSLRLKFDDADSTTRSTQVAASNPSHATPTSEQGKVSEEV